MLKIVSICLVLSLSLLAILPMGSAGTENESSGDYIVNRGIVGVVYSVVVGVAKTIEAVIFGKYGVVGLKDYFQFNKIFQEQTPQY